MTERVYGEIDHTGYCKRCPDRTRCFVNEGCVQDAHEKKQADARALWAVKVLLANVNRVPGKRFSLIAGDSLQTLVAQAEALVAEDPSLDPAAKAAEKAKATEQQTDCAAQEEAERRVHAEADRFGADVKKHMERVAELKAKEEANG